MGNDAQGRRPSDRDGHLPPLPPFVGAPTLLDLFDAMVNEPDRSQPRPHWPTRVELISDQARPEQHLLQGLAKHYRSTVPTTWVNGEGFESTGDERSPSTPALRLLDAIVTGLRTNKRGLRRGFRRYDFVRWLLGQNFTAAGRERRNQIRGRHGRYMLNRLRQPAEAAIGALPDGPWWATLLRGVAWPFVELTYVVGIRILPHYRWATKQALSGVGQPGDLLDFAVRVAEWAENDSNVALLERLAVRAFLADLERLAPAKRSPVRWKRRARQPVLIFIDNLVGSSTKTADDLLELVAKEQADAEADPTRADSIPAVFVTNSVEDKPKAKSLEDDRDLLTEWRRNRSASNGPNAGDRSLHIRLPSSDLQDDSEAKRHTVAKLEREAPKPAGPPTRLVLAGVGLVAVIGLATAGLWVWSTVQHRCGEWFPTDDTIVRKVPDGHCTGVTDLTYQFVPPEQGFGEPGPEYQRLQEAQEEIRQNNAEIEQRAESSNAHYVNVVYLSAIADRQAAGGSLAGPRAELEGLAIAQRRRMEDQNPGLERPLVRVLVANAGPAMRDAETVARDIGRLVEEKEDSGHPIVGVVGLGQSVADLSRAMHILEGTGVPMVGSVTSYDNLPDHSLNYFGVAPNNRREAQTAAYYASQHFAGIETVKVIRSSAARDSYSRNLADDVKEEFENAFSDNERFSATVVPYETVDSKRGEPLDAIGQEACRDDGLIFFAGRAQDFESLLSGMETGCGGRTYPNIIAGDDVTRTVLEGGLDKYPGLELHYMALASSAGTCNSGGDLARIYGLNEELFDRGCPDASDGRMLLSYDSFQVIQHAVDIVADLDDNNDDEREITGPTVRSAIEQIRKTNGRDHTFSGASGVIDFGSDRDRRIPVNKVITVLTISGDEQAPNVALRCGQLYKGDTRSDPGCPVDPGVSR